MPTLIIKECAHVPVWLTLPGALKRHRSPRAHNMRQNYDGFGGIINESKAFGSKLIWKEL